MFLIDLAVFLLVLLVWKTRIRITCYLIILKTGFLTLVWYEQAGESLIGLQYGSNKGASQAGMTPYGASRQIRPEGNKFTKLGMDKD